MPTPVCLKKKKKIFAEVLNWGKKNPMHVLNIMKRYECVDMLIAFDRWTILKLIFVNFVIYKAKINYI